MRKVKEGKDRAFLQRQREQDEEQDARATQAGRRGMQAGAALT